MNDLVKVENPLDVMFGESVGENSLFSLVSSAKSPEEVMDRIWNHQFEDEDAEEYDTSENDMPQFPYSSI